MSTWFFKTVFPKHKIFMKIVFKKIIFFLVALVIMNVPIKCSLLLYKFSINAFIRIFRLNVHISNIINLMLLQLFVIICKICQIIIWEQKNLAHRNSSFISDEKASKTIFLRCLGVIRDSYLKQIIEDFKFPIHFEN